MMTNLDTAAVVRTLLSAKKPIPGATEREQASCDYLAAGLLDSLGLINLIGSIESTFGIMFEAEDFEDPRFKTVGGLVAIVEERRRA